MPTSVNGWPVTQTYAGLLERLVILIDERASAGGTRLLGYLLSSRSWHSFVASGLYFRKEG